MSVHEIAIYYRDTGTFSVNILFALIIASILHFKYEMNDFLDYAPFSIRDYYLRTLAIITAITAFSILLSITILETVSVKKIFIIYATVLLVDLFFKVCISLFLKKIYTSSANLKKMLIVGNNKRSSAFSCLLRENEQLGITVLGYVDSVPGDDSCMPCLGSLDDFEGILRAEEVDIVAIFLPIRSFYDINKNIIETAEYLGITIYYMAGNFEPDRAEVRFSSVRRISSILYYSAPAESWRLTAR